MWKNLQNKILNKITDAVSARLLPHKKPAPLAVPATDHKLTSDQAEELLKLSFQRDWRTCFKQISDHSHAMDAMPAIKSPKSIGLEGLGQDIIYTFFAKHGFIGWQLCALLAQHWLIHKACTMPNQDAVRPAWENSFAEQDAAADSDILTRLYEKSLQDYHLPQKLVEFGTNRKIFGIGIAFPVVEGVDLSVPFNPDGVKPGSYKGIAIIDPYWCLPSWSAEAMSDPGNLHFYEPEYYTFQFNGKMTRVHRSHLIISTHGVVPDILKPSYYFGGIPLPQMIYERVYAAEKVANEAPELALTKRLLVVKSDHLEQSFLQPEETVRRMDWLAYLRNNKGVYLTDNDVSQLDTALTDFDQLIMTQYQLVCAIADIPQYKLLGTQFKGLNSTGEGETKNYIQTLQSLQDTVFMPLIERHNLLSMRSDFESKETVRATFNPVDMPTEKELAEVEAMKAQSDTAYVNAGVLSAEEVRAKVSADKSNGYNDLSEELPADLDLEEGAFNTTEPHEEGTDKAMDADFKESEHPRDDDGKFTNGSNSNPGKEQSSIKSPKPLKEFLGKEYTGVKGQAAVEKLLQEKQGHVKAAFTRKDIGDIDLLWGDEEKGLAHLIKRREEDGHYLPKDILGNLTEIVEKGQLSKNIKGKYEIWHNRVVIVVAPDYYGENLRWVITGFKQRKPNKNQ